MDPDNLRALDLLSCLVDVQLALQVNMAKKAQDLGLTLPQSLVSQDLARYPGSTLQDICQRLRLPKSSVSRLVDELVQKGHATRDVPPDNRRVVALSLNDNLKVKCMSSATETFFPGAGGRLDPDEAVQIKATLVRIQELLQE